MKPSKGKVMAEPKYRKFNDIKRSRANPEQLARTQQWVEHETLKMNLRELRKQLGVTQKQLADKIKMAQSELSRTEHRSDHLLSTLKGYVEGLGGRLEIRAVFDDKQVELHGI